MARTRRTTGILACYPFFHREECKDKRKVLESLRLIKPIRSVEFEETLQIFRNKQRDYKKLCKSKKRLQGEEETQIIWKKCSVDDATDI